MDYMHGVLIHPQLAGKEDERFRKDKGEWRMTPRSNGEGYEQHHGRTCRRTQDRIGQRLAGALLVGGMTLAAAVRALGAEPGPAVPAATTSPVSAANPVQGAGTAASSAGGLPQSFDVNEYIV